MELEDRMNALDKRMMEQEKMSMSKEFKALHKEIADLEAQLEAAATKSVEQEQLIHEQGVKLVEAQRDEQTQRRTAHELTDSLAKREAEIEKLERMLEVAVGTCVVLGNQINPQSDATIKGLTDLLEECPYVLGEGTLKECLAYPDPNK